MMTTERDISLEEAVRKAKPVRFATWITSGNILENTLVENIFASRVSVSWIIGKTGFSVTLGINQGAGNSSLTDLGNFPNLEKVKETFPKLFREVGTLRVR